MFSIFLKVLGIGFLIILSLFSNLHLLKEISTPKKDYLDKYIFLDTYVIIFNEERLKELKKILPPRGIIGYFSDTPLREEEINAEASALFYSTQYILSPIIVVDSLHYPIVLGNFLNPYKGLELARKKGLTPLKNFGRGIILFRNLSK